MVLDAFDSGSRDRVSTGNQRHQRDRDKREREFFQTTFGAIQLYRVGFAPAVASSSQRARALARARPNPVTSEKPLAQGYKRHCTRRCK